MQWVNTTKDQKELNTHLTIEKDIFIMIKTSGLDITYVVWWN